MSESGAYFLYDREPALHTSHEVENVVAYANANTRTRDARVPNDPIARISVYLGFLADTERANYGLLTGDQKGIEQQINARVIKAEHVPESYFELQRRIAREEGYGDNSITDRGRENIIDTVQQDQRESLTRWTDYLTGDAADAYPDWFKAYVFESVVQLSEYDKSKQLFRRRTQGTVSKFPDLNREALALVYDSVSSKAAALQKQSEEGRTALDVEEKEALSSASNFNKLYSVALQEAASGYPAPEELEITRGSWRTFQQSDSPEDAKELADSLQGRGTGWCTSGEGTAATHLESGDFLVYFTQDRDGQDKIPRIAIRMQFGEVVEVRGIVGGGDNVGAAENTSQELEVSMLDIAQEKLRSLHGGDQYVQRAEDMKWLTDLEQRLISNSDAEFSEQDLRFLYEMDREIQGFGYDRDPRIDEIRLLRGQKDLPEVLNMLPELIHQQLEEAYTIYKRVAIRLDAGFSSESDPLLDRSEVDYLFDFQDREWRRNGVYEYAARRIIAKGARYNLVITPQIAVSERQINELIGRFAREEYMSRGSFPEGQRNAAARSSTVAAEEVSFGLISSVNGSEVDAETANEQLHQLKQLQEDLPSLKLRVPSYLETIVYWSVLRRSAIPLTSRTTQMRYINSERIHRFGPEWPPVIPTASVDSRGFIKFDEETSECKVNARLALG